MDSIYEYYVENIICKTDLANMVTTQGYGFISDRLNVEPPPASTGYGLEMGGSNPDGVERFSANRPDRPRGPPGFQYNGHRVIPGGKAAEAWC